MRLPVGEVEREMVGLEVTLSEGEREGDRVGLCVEEVEGDRVGEREAPGEAEVEGESVPLGVMLGLGLTEAEEEGDTLRVTEWVGEGVLPLDRQDEALAVVHPLGEPLRLGDRDALGLRVSVPVTVPLPLREECGEGLGVRLGLPLPLPHLLPPGVALEQPLMLRVRVRDPLPHPVPLPLAVPLPVGLGQGQGETLGLGEGVEDREPEGEPLLERVGEGLEEGQGLVLRDWLPHPLSLPLPVGEALRVGEGEVEGDRDWEADTLGEGVPWGLLEAHPLALGERVGERDPEGVGEVVEEREGVGQPLGLRLEEGEREVLTVAHLDIPELPLRDPEGVVLPQRLPLRVYVPLGQALGVRVRVEAMDPLAHREGEADTVGKEALGVLLAVGETVEHWEALGDREAQEDPEAEADREEDPDWEGEPEGEPDTLADRVTLVVYCPTVGVPWMLAEGEAVADMVEHTIWYSTLYSFQLYAVAQAWNSGSHRVMELITEGTYRSLHPRSSGQQLLAVMYPSEVSTVRPCQPPCEGRAIWPELLVVG